MLLETAPLLRDPRIRILICGDGVQRDSLAERVRQLELPNVSLLPLQAGQDYRALLVDADVCLITQQAGAGNSFFPSKLLGILAESRPIVTVAAPECELALSLTEGKFGVNVPPGRLGVNIKTVRAEDDRTYASGEDRLPELIRA